MKVLLVTLNAKYIHAALALYTLQSYLKSHGFETKVREFTINQELQWILGQIIRESPELVGFSCNIWNTEATLVLCRRLKAVKPEIRILLGGPEVDPAPVDLLHKAQADFAVVGEGEEPSLGLLRALYDNMLFGAVPGLVWRDGDSIMVNESSAPLCLDRIPFPYSIEVLQEPGRIFYYETSRGCPFSCAYCLSGVVRGMRYLSLERVFADLHKLVNAEVRQVKFVDRTFNTDPRRTVEILRYIIDNFSDSSTNFHLELVGEILSEETLQLLTEAPDGLFRVEVGIQSLHPPTLAAIGRRNDPDKLAKNLQRLFEAGNTPVHLDLIAGLPWEGMAEFAYTFDWTYRLRPNELQLGILKLLKGSVLGQKAPSMGYVATEEAPYEVMITPWLTFKELGRLKTIAHLVDVYHNSGHFKHSLFHLCTAECRSPFAVFHQLAECWETEAMDVASHGLRELFRFIRHAVYGVLTEAKAIDIIHELLRLDYALADWSFNGDESWGEAPDLPESLRHALMDTAWVTENLPELATFAPGDRRRRVRRWRLGIDPRSPESGEHTTDVLVYRPAQGRNQHRVYDGLLI